MVEVRQHWRAAGDGGGNDFEKTHGPTESYTYWTLELLGLQTLVSDHGT